MDSSGVFAIDNVLLTRRGHHIKGHLVLSRYHMVFSFRQDKTSERSREIWICYPIIERISKARGCSWKSNVQGAEISNNKSANLDDFDSYSASHIRVSCKDFTFYSFDFAHDSICSEVYHKLSKLATTPKLKGNINEFYAFDYKPNAFEATLKSSGWSLYDAEREYKRLCLLPTDSNQQSWRLSKINSDYRFCPSYPNVFIVPACVSDSVLQHAGKFRSKQRIPVVVYKHRQGENRNIIARCSQPLVGLNLQNRSLQDEKLIEEIFKSQCLERSRSISADSDINDQPHRNLIVDLRPLTNAMAQHALGAGTENVDNYRSKDVAGEESSDKRRVRGFQQVDKIFCNIDNIHVMRDSLDKLNHILSDLDKNPISLKDASNSSSPLLQQSLTKTQWLNRLSIILQSVDRITKSVHLNNTNVLIHCSDGWDRTSQVSALSQLCLDPYYRTIKGFMILIEKEWLSFGFKFATRGDHGGCIGAIIPNEPTELKQDTGAKDSESLYPSSLASGEIASMSNSPFNQLNNGAKLAVSSFLQRAASHIKSTASAATSVSIEGKGEKYNPTVYGGSNERSPIFHQFLDCVYQIYRQKPSKFEFNSRFLKRLLYHSYSCQYGTFLCNSEKSSKLEEKLFQNTISAWDYFLSRQSEFLNPQYDEEANNDVLFFNYSEVKWWYELYGRSDEEMNGLSNSLDRKFAKLRLQKLSVDNASQSEPPSVDENNTQPRNPPPIQ